MAGKTLAIEITSAVVIDGEIARAGSKVEVAEIDAKDLLRRGKAVLVGDADASAGTDAAADEGATDASEQAAIDRAMKDNELDAEAWGQLSNEKRKALAKAAADAIAADAVA